MWIWTYLLLGVAILSGVLGFGDLNASISFTARIAFGISMVLFVLALLAELTRLGKTQITADENLP